jgi:ankyrin repeat protein
VGGCGRICASSLPSLLVSLSQEKTRKKATMSTLDELLYDVMRSSIVRTRKYKEARRLIKDGASVHFMNDVGLTPLHTASRRNDLIAVFFLADNGADVDCKATDGQTPLHIAAMHGHAEIVRFLVSNGANVNGKTYNHGWTPLHDASYNGHIDVALFLIDNGADLSIKSNSGMTTLDVAKTKDVADKLSRKVLTLKNTFPAAADIQDQLKMLIQENKQQKSDIKNLQEKQKSERASISEQHKKEIAAIQDKLDTVIEENKRKKSVESALAGPKRAKIEAEAAQAKDEAAQAKDERIFNLMIKRKELEAAGFSAIEIDLQLPLPQQDDDEPNKKRRRRGGKKEET